MNAVSGRIQINRGDNTPAEPRQSQLHIGECSLSLSLSLSLFYYYRQTVLDQKMQSSHILINQAIILTLVYTLSKISNRSPYIFYASFESKIRLYKMHSSINQPRSCQDTAGHFI